MGRKPVKDKAVPLTIYIQQSIIDKCGGKEQSKEYAISYLYSLAKIYDSNTGVCIPEIPIKVVPFNKIDK